MSDQHDPGRAGNPRFKQICLKNGLQTRILSIQASSSAEIRAFWPYSTIKIGFEHLRMTFNMACWPPRRGEMA